MKHQKLQQTEDIDYQYPTREGIGFKFVYVQAVDPDWAENLIKDLREED